MDSERPLLQAPRSLQSLRLTVDPQPGPRFPPTAIVEHTHRAKASSTHLLFSGFVLATIHPSAMRNLIADSGGWDCSSSALLVSTSFSIRILEIGFAEDQSARWNTCFFTLKPAKGGNTVLIEGQYAASDAITIVSVTPMLPCSCQAPQ